MPPHKTTTKVAATISAPIRKKRSDSHTPFTWRPNRPEPLASLLKDFLGEDYHTKKCWFVANDGMRITARTVSVPRTTFTVVASLFDTDTARWLRPQTQIAPWPEKLALKFPIKVFYDFETSGLDVKTLQILQLAAVKLYPDGRIERFMRYCHHEKFDIAPEASAVNGLFADDWRLATAPCSVADVMKQFSTFIEARDQHVFLIAHNGCLFDHKILLTHGGPALKLPQHTRFVDSLIIARKLNPEGHRALVKAAEFRNVCLSRIETTLVNEFDWEELLSTYPAPELNPHQMAIKCASAHDALFDSEVLMHLYLEMEKDPKFRLFHF